MKPLTTLLLLLALFALTNMSNCDGEDDGYLEPYTESSFTLLQVDYQTLDFEAGNFVPAAPVTTPADTLPIAVTYNSPGDFGDILLASTIDNDTVFFGTIVWAGTGQRISPAQLTRQRIFKPLMQLPHCLRSRTLILSASTPKMPTWLNSGPPWPICRWCTMRLPIRVVGSGFLPMPVAWVSGIRRSGIILW